MIISLIGYRATGKTTLAHVLGDQLCWPWCDTDAEVERRAQKSISDIFAQEGELAFRDQEEAVVRDLCNRERMVLATGGGAILRAVTREKLRQSGLVIWLVADVDTIYQRMMADSTTIQRRPNLTEHGGKEEIRQLLAQREPLYRETADFILDTTALNPESMSGVVLEWLKEHPKKEAFFQEKRDHD